MAKEKKKLLECEECGPFSVLYEGNRTVECCPFCGETVSLISKSRPPLNNFEDLDEEDYYEEDELMDEED